MKKAQDYYKQLLKTNHERFQRKVANLDSAHKEVLENIEQKFKNEIHNLLVNNQEQKKLVEDKSQDSFYHMKTINPEIVDQEKHYFVSIKVPPYEKENVTLAPRDRTLRLSFNRRFAERVENENGYLKSRRSEILVRELHVPELTDPHSVAQKYENGILTFKVAKK